MMDQTNQTLVKICGIREESTIRGMRGLPVDLIGFMFAPSKRQVTAEQAAKLLALSRDTPMKGGQPPRAVGVFVNPGLDGIADVMASVPLDIVQLHGQESPAFCREAALQFGVEIWRAFAADEADESRLADYEGAVTDVLVDTAGGGTGRTFRWDIIPSWQETARGLGMRLFVAGGLTADNVSGLLSAYRPDGVDISSGVETDGKKDIMKIAAFAERVNRT